MGNFSRNTFDPTKNYVGVRLQQGVPLVDADWNEMDDAIRNEIYTGFTQLFPDGIRPGTPDLQISPGSPPANNVAMAAGAILVGGCPLRVPAAVTYTAQPWFNNPARAAQDGVAVIPPLTTPTDRRSDLVYLDIWEREVRSTEDSNLINPAIGVETCVRVKRDLALRVAEGTRTLPAVPAGHSFVPLAELTRSVGQTDITAGQISDLRPKLFNLRGARSLAFAPAFFADGSGANPWSFSVSGALCTVANGVGLLPLPLPDGATLLSVRIQGTSAEVHFVLHRLDPPAPGSNQLFNESFVASGGSGGVFFDRVCPVATQFNVVDNSRHSYVLRVQNGSTAITQISRVTVNYRY